MSRHQWLSNRDERFRAAVADETVFARRKFPQPNPTLAALVEEVGELAKALLCESDKCVWDEAVQVAAMAQRVATEGDPTLGREKEMP